VGSPQTKPQAPTSARRSPAQAGNESRLQWTLSVLTAVNHALGMLTRIAVDAAARRLVFEETGGCQRPQTAAGTLQAAIQPDPGALADSCNCNRNRNCNCFPMSANLTLTARIANMAEDADAIERP
jgi:hypothetical protein